MSSGNPDNPFPYSLQRERQIAFFPITSTRGRGPSHLGGKRSLVFSLSPTGLLMCSGWKKVIETPICSSLQAKKRKGIWFGDSGIKQHMQQKGKNRKKKYIEAQQWQHHALGRNKGQCWKRNSQGLQKTRECDGGSTTVEVQSYSGEVQIIPLQTCTFDYRCIPLPTHPKSKLPPMHVSMFCKIPVIKHSFDSGLLEQGCIQMLQNGGMQGREFYTSGLDQCKCAVCV